MTLYEFKKGGPFRMLCYNLEALTYRFMPDLFNFFQKHGVPVDIYASTWFVTMFSTDLSFDIIPSIIDLYLHLGVRALL